MNIQSVSKEKRNVVVELDADELVILCNVLHTQMGEQKRKEKTLNLYSDMMLARDICQYGRVDNFCLSNIARCRNSIGKGLQGVLLDEDVALFASYLGDNDISSAFEDPEWVRIYETIVGNYGKRSVRKGKEQSDNGK